MRSEYCTNLGWARQPSVETLGRTYPQVLIVLAFEYYVLLIHFDIAYAEETQVAVEFSGDTPIYFYYLRV